MKAMRGRIEKIRDFISENLAQDLSIPSLAERFNTSESTLRRHFKLHCGMPVHQYVLKSRMDTAMLLLKESDFTIAEVAAMVGYQQSSSFTVSFIRYFHVLPSKIRNTSK